MHGDEKGSVDKKHNQYRLPMVDTNLKLKKYQHSKLKHPPVNFSSLVRESIQEVITEACSFKEWELHAINVRTDHVHVVVTAKGKDPEFALKHFKSRVTRVLCERKMFKKDIKLWSRHGSTVWIFNEKELQDKINYVLNCQD